MGSRQSFAIPQSRDPSAMIGQYTLKPDTHSNRDTGYGARGRSASARRAFNFSVRRTYRELNEAPKRYSDSEYS